MTGPLGRKVRAQRAEIKCLAAKAGVTNLRVFGRVARGQETARSDIDLLVGLSTATGLLTLAALRGRLERLLEAKVDLVPVDSQRRCATERAKRHREPVSRRDTQRLEDITAAISAIDAHLQRGNLSESGNVVPRAWRPSRS